MELSRRTFTALAGTAALGLALTGSGGAAPRPDAPRVAPTGPPPGPPGADGERHEVGFDRYSLLVDGRRLVLWSGELPFFRLPSPSLWRDVLQRMRAHGYNAVDVPVAWNYHSPAPGRHDFTGVRDLDLLLRTAAETGLYVVLRPGPYIGAGLDGGGLPGWLTAAGVRARTTDPEYLRHADAWLSAVHAVAARHLFTRGTGTVLLYRIEDAHGSHAYRDHLRRRARADGIDVPLLDGDGDERADDGRPGPRRGPDHARAGRTSDAADERRARLADLADGVRVHRSTAFGGTSWGWLSASAVPAPHDRGAAFGAARNQTAALAPLHQLGHLLRHVPDLAKLERAARAAAADPRLEVRRLTNPDTGARVHVLRNDSAEDVSTTLPDAGIDVPVTVAARDARLLTTGLRLGRRKLAYSTVPPMLALGVGRQDIAVFAGRRGEMAQVVLECREQPVTTRLDREPAWSYADGRLTVAAPLGAGGLSRVRVEGGDDPRPLLLLFADDATSLRLWPRETPSGPLLVYGPALLRDVALRGSTAHLTGDTVAETGLEVWGPPGLTDVTWNGRPVRTRVSATGSLMAQRLLPGVSAPVPPALGGWRRRTENPESEPGFDDSGWTVAGRTASPGTASSAAAPVPGGQPVLSADGYGFHHGDVWYRGEFTDARGVTSVSLSYGTGPQGLLMAWLDGHPLGTHRTPVPDGDTAERGTRTATAAFAVPRRLRGPGRHVLSVLVRPTRDDRDGRDDQDQQARGLASVRFAGASPDVTWRLCGAAGPDPVRGPVNNGGLYGEREGWHLPGHDDAGWQPVEFPRADRRQGVTWYRTAFRLDVDPGVDASFGLVLDDDPDRAYRVQVFLNGWNMGQYVNDAGPRHPFVLPNGILRTRGENTLALAVLADGTTPAGPGDVRLTLPASAAGGVPVEPVGSPGR
ncbi:beta-galactosidase [Streptomyces sp. NPDC052701]|uniref:glycoside hydrolase family 35 protein n=1 Tax=Streptomyces sp. NPDC052701 TaxID=3155533 RepID=UPI0034391861